MHSYKNISQHPEDLAGGRVVAVAEVFDLSADEEKEPHNKNKIDEGVFIAVKTKSRGGES